MHVRPINPMTNMTCSPCGLVVPQNNPAKDIGRKLLVDPQLFLVGTVDAVLVASVIGGYEGHRGWINYLAAQPSIHRQGYGREIMSVIEERLRDLGCPKINLQVRSTNEDVVAF